MFLYSGKCIILKYTFRNLFTHHLHLLQFDRFHYNCYRVLLSDVGKVKGSWGGRRQCTEKLWIKNWKFPFATSQGWGNQCLMHKIKVWLFLAIKCRYVLFSRKEVLASNSRRKFNLWALYLSLWEKLISRCMWYLSFFWSSISEVLAAQLD